MKKTRKIGSGAVDDGTARIKKEKTSTPPGDGSRKAEAEKSALFFPDNDYSR